MATPVLIDTDMAADSAVALALALASESIDLRAVVGVAGAVPLNQAVANISRLLDALRPPAQPLVGLGLDQSGAALRDRRTLFGTDGLGAWDRPIPANDPPQHFETVYEKTINAAHGELVILALGPLTNLAAMIENSPELFKRVKRIHITGGAVWCRGNVTTRVEFNFHRDPRAAAAVLASGLPITVVPLDVTSLVCFDESHVAHLAASGYRTGQVPAELLEHALEYDGEPAYGKSFIAPALTVGSLLWPQLFMKTRMQLQVVAEGPEAGQTKPALGGDKSRHIDLLTAVNAVDFLENLLESLCHEAFVV